VSSLAEFLIAAMEVAGVKLVQARAGAYQLLLALALLGLGGLFLLAGSAFLLLAVNLALREHLPMWQASLATAGVSLCLGALLAWVGKTRAE